jgi:transcriptional antiterminator RfaH
MKWYVASTHPRQELRAESNLRRQGFEAWLPKLVRDRRHARRVDTTSAPLFPGYLFIAMDMCSHRWRAINSTFGVRHVLCHGETPRAVECGFVETLLASADDAGVVSMPGVDELVPGQPLRLVSGPFANYIGTLLSLADKDRVALLLNLLGREVQVRVARSQVVAVA